MNLNRVLCKYVGVICLASLSLGAFAQGAFPNKSLKIVVPFGAGGVADLTARTVAQKLGENLGQSIVIENKPGGNGVVAAQALTSSIEHGVIASALGAKTEIVAHQ